MPWKTRLTSKVKDHIRTEFPRHYCSENETYGIKISRIKKSPLVVHTTHSVILKFTAKNGKIFLNKISLENDLRMTQELQSLMRLHGDKILQVNPGSSSSFPGHRQIIPKHWGWPQVIPKNWEWFSKHFNQNFSSWCKLATLCGTYLVQGYNRYTENWCIFRKENWPRISGSSLPLSRAPLFSRHPAGTSVISF